MPTQVRRNTKAAGISVLRATNPKSLSGIRPTIGVLMRPMTSILTARGQATFGALRPNRIFEAWPDGYEIPTNGALVGNELPPYAEQRVVHSGIQSMPYFYDNSVGNSEATHTLTYPRDWTENGVTTLSIWFRGGPDNAAETLYVALNGSAIVSHDNPNAAQINKWTEWTIDLQAFADQGVNLANVNTIALGLGDKNNPQAGGSGKMYFDDIRLYPLAP